MKISTTKVKRTIINLSVLIFWLLLWQIISIAIGIEMLIPTPLSVCAKLFEMAQTAEFWYTIFMTVVRVLIGFSIGAVLGALFAFAAFRSELFYRFVSPIIYIVKSTPVASFIIIVLFWAGTSNVPAIICILMIVPITWGNILSGLKSVNKEYLEMASIYKFSYFKRVRHIYLPSITPYIASAFGTGLGLCWKAGIAAEVICRSNLSIGNEIFESKLYGTIVEMFAWTVVVIVLSVIFDKLLNMLTLRVKGKFADGEVII